MRAWWCCAVLALSACNPAPDRGPAAPGSEAASGGAVVPSTSAPVPAAAAGAQALLDGEVTPRQKGTYPPADDCGKLPGAEDFRSALAAAVLAKDANAVASLALPTVRLGFGGEDGRERLRKQLAAPDGKLMAELAALLRLGCAADAEGGITMPWYFTQDFGDVDSYSAMLVTGADVPLRAAADPASPAKQRLSWALVTLEGGLMPGKPFQHVVTADGVGGYMPTDRLRSLLAYRLLASREGGQWRINALVAGD